MGFDALVVGILLFTTIRGAMKGLVWQLATITALVLCFVFAKSLSISIAPAIPLDEPLNRWVAMAVLYFVFSFLCFTAARQLKDWIDKAKFTEYDRHLGGIFGFVKGAAICLVLTFFLVTLSESMRSKILQTRSGYMAAIIMDQLHPVMPDELHAILEPYIHQLDQPDMDLHAHDDEHESHLGKPGTLLGTETDLKSPSNPMVDNDVWGIVMNVVKKLPPEQRDQLEEKLKGMSPAELINIATQMKLDGQGNNTIPNFPGTNPDVPPFDETLPAPKETSPPFVPNPQERSRLLQEIAAALTGDPVKQSGVIRAIENQLDGVPDQVAMATLRDFHADLLQQPDPDPETQLETAIESRIVRQLDKAGIPIQTLSREVQDRLQ